MVLLASFAGIVLAIFLLDRLDVVGRSKGAVSLMRGAVASLADPALDDLAKERISRAASVGLLCAAGSIGMRLVAAIAFPFALFWTGAWAGLFSLDEIAAFLMSWPGIGLSLALLLIMLFYRRWPAS
jgi:hypothetical protein